MKSLAERCILIVAIALSGCSDNLSEQDRIEEEKASAYRSSEFTPAEEFEVVMALFPTDSRIPDLLRDCMSTDAKTRKSGQDALDQVRVEMYRGELKQTEVEGLVHAYLKVKFPWEGMYNPRYNLGLLLAAIPARQSQPLIDLYRDSYIDNPEYHGDLLLRLLASTGTKRGAQAFLDCIKTCGWPEFPSPRIFDHFKTMEAEASKVLFPALFQQMEAEVPILHLAELLVTTDRDIATSEHLASISSVNFNRLAEAVNNLSSLIEDEQLTNDDGWRLNNYMESFRLQAFLKIASRVRDQKSVVHLKRALGFSVPEVRLHAVIACISCGVEVDAEIIKWVAGEHICRDKLFLSLESMDRLDLYPQEFRTWEAFALSDGIANLSNELEYIEADAEMAKQVTFLAPNGQEYVAFLWRVRETEESEYKGCVTGPFQLVGEPRPFEKYGNLAQYIPWNWDESDRQDYIERVTGWLQEQVLADQ